MQHFPEAFNRFRRTIPIRDIKTYNQLLFRFIQWGKEHTPMTEKQRDAFNIQAKKLGLDKGVIREKYYTPKRNLERYRLINSNTGKIVGRLNKDLNNLYRKYYQ